MLRNDKNKPVAGTLNVTFSNWEPQGNGAYDITPYKTIEVKSSANGKFTIPKVTTKTEETVFIEAVGDGESELSTVTQEVNIQRYVIGHREGARRRQGEGDGEGGRRPVQGLDRIGRLSRVRRRGAQGEQGRRRDLQPRPRLRNPRHLSSTPAN